MAHFPVRHPARVLRTFKFTPTKFVNSRGSFHYPLNFQYRKASPLSVRADLYN